MRTAPILAAVVSAFAFAPAAKAAVPQVFTTSPTPVTCTTQASGSTAGQRFCMGATGPYNVSTVGSFDGTPIDVSVTLPPAPSGPTDGNYPVVGVFHGYGGQKYLPSTSAVQRWVTQGYAVLSITDRGFWGSCGALVPIKPSACSNGYIHLMSNAYEVRDAQYLLGLLADDGVIDPQRIGAQGGSYGGGMSIQLGALRNRVQLPDNTLIPWTSPAGKPMQIAATAPEYGWSDLQASLQPNGSTLDYAAQNPYTGPNGDRRFGVEKALFSTQLYAGGAAAGYYAPTTGPGFPDPTANITAWKAFNDTGGPYDGQPLALQQMAEFPHHGAAYTDDSEAPAPALISNGWNDDLFPVSEAVRYYNRVRANHPNAPIKMFHLNIGHSPRGAGTTPADAGKLFNAEDAWFDYYVRGRGAEPSNPRGGVNLLSTRCVGTTPSDGVPFSAENWAALSPGEIRVDGAGAQTVASNSAPSESFQKVAPDPPTNPCTNGPSADTTGAAVYKTAPAPDSGYTIAGSPTVIADLTVTGANDALLSRLYDVDTAAGTEKLIARGVYRPTGVGGTTRQVFQLFPQTYRIAPGHVAKLELLGEDQPYMLKSTGQNAIGVKNLQLRLPTIEGPGALGGLIQTPAAKVLPAGYTMARDVPSPPAPPQPKPPTPTPPAPPAPPTTDPVPWQTVRTALRKTPKNVRLSRNRSQLTFTDSVPEAGRITYGISVTLRDHGRKVYSIGQARHTVTKAGSFKVTFKIGSRGRTILKNHPKATITLKSYFVTAIEHRHINSVRQLKRK